MKCDRRVCVHQKQEEAQRHEGPCTSANLFKNLHPTLPSLPPRGARAHSCLTGVTRTEELTLTKCPALLSHRQSHGRCEYTAQSDSACTFSEMACQHKHCFNLPLNHIMTAKCCQNKWKVGAVLERVKKAKRKILMGEKLSNGHLIP